VGPALCSGLGRSLGDPPPILNNGVDHTLIMALNHAFVRLHNGWSRLRHVLWGTVRRTGCAP